MWFWRYEEDDEYQSVGFDTRKEAIDDAVKTAKNSGSHDRIAILQCNEIPMPTHISAEDVLNKLDEQFSSEHDSENYLYEGLINEAYEWLENELSNIMLRFNEIANLHTNRYEIISQEFVDLFTDVDESDISFLESSMQNKTIRLNDLKVMFKYKPYLLDIHEIEVLQSYLNFLGPKHIQWCTENIFDSWFIDHILNENIENNLFKKQDIKTGWHILYLETNEFIKNYRSMYPCK